MKFFDNKRKNPVYNCFWLIVLLFIGVWISILGSISSISHDREHKSSRFYLETLHNLSNKDRLETLHNISNAENTDDDDDDDDITEKTDYISKSNKTTQKSNIITDNKNNNNDNNNNNDHNDNNNNKVQRKFRLEPPMAAVEGCTFSLSKEGELPGCALAREEDGVCKKFESFTEAIEACLDSFDSCAGITMIEEDMAFELRGSVQPIPKEGHFSYVMYCEEERFALPPLPEWYQPPPGQDLDTIGTYVNGHPTILIKSSSYRDDLCPGSITGALERAAHPERVFIATVDQYAPGDIACTDPPIPCAQDPSQTLCKAIADGRMRTWRMPARLATGPTFARHVGDRQYNGEYFVLQIDAHIQFANNWDEDLIEQWKATKNEKAVISTYPQDTKNPLGNPSIDENGEPTFNNTAVMCEWKFDFHHVIQQGKAQSLLPPKRLGKSPVLHPFWAAGFSFARGHFHVRVPYDPNLPMLFQGEEMAIALRGWTYGYDFYAAHHSRLFHPYHRGKSMPPKFWENTLHQGEGNFAANRVLIEMGQQPHEKPNGKVIDLTEIEKYSIGTERKIEDFNFIFGIDWQQEKPTRNLCKWIVEMKMHEQFTKYLRENRNGIDYQQILDPNNNVVFAPEIKEETENDVNFDEDKIQKKATA